MPFTSPESQLQWKKKAVQAYFDSERVCAEFGPRGREVGGDPGAEDVFALLEQREHSARGHDEGIAAWGGGVGYARRRQVGKEALGRGAVLP
jgi:hypothetical protein